MTKVSVVVPVYNLEFYIERCLESLAKQTCQDIEVLVVNDGGSDDSQLIIDEYVQQYPHIFKSFIKPNGGHGSACNFGINRAIGEYLIIVDGDDFLDHDTIEYMYNKAEETGADLLIGNLLYCYDGHTEPFKPLPIDSERELTNSDRDLLYRNWATPCGRIYHRSIFDDKDVRLREGIIFADANFAPKSYLVAKKIYYVNKELYNYDISRPTQSLKQTDKRILNIIPALTDMLDFYIKKDAFEANQQRLIWYVDRHCVAWIQKIRHLTGYNKKKALNELFAVPETYFGSKWIKDPIIIESFGRKAHRLVRVSRKLRFYPFILSWSTKDAARSIDKSMENILNLPLKGYRFLKRKIKSIL